MASTNNMSLFLASIKEGGTFVVPPCVVSSLELNPLGYQCYGDPNVVRDPVCLLPSLGENQKESLTITQYVRTR